MNDEEHFLITLKGGGGPQPLRRALARKFAELRRRGSWCVVVGPVDRPARYVQAMVNPAGLRVESVGSLYLLLPDALTEAELAALDAFGWLPPPEPGDPDWMWPYNWWREFAGPGCLHDAAGLMVATLIEVHQLKVDEPVGLTVFPSANRHYRWRVDVTHPCGGQLTPV